MYIYEIKLKYIHLIYICIIFLIFKVIIHTNIFLIFKVKILENFP